MDDKDLTKLWNKALNELFNSFINKHIGYKEGVKEISKEMPKSPAPKCYGTGDSKAICPYCCFYKSC